MRKEDLIKHLVKRNALTQSQAIRVIDSVFGALGDALAKGDDIYLRGFGSFVQKTSAPRQVHDFKNGRTFLHPAQHVVRFKLSKSINERLNP